VEGFDKSSMNHAETTEKNPLPPIEGLLLSLMVVFGDNSGFCIFCCIALYL
jgi:hypothetical protein